MLELNKGVVPYDLATPLFSDYALKLRTVYLPKGEPAIYNAEDAFDFPVGTIITKTFFFPQTSAEWDGNVSYGEDRTVHDGVMPLEGVRLIERGIWYISAAHTADHVEQTLRAADRAFAKVA